MKCYLKILLNALIIITAITVSPSVYAEQRWNGATLGVLNNTNINIDSALSAWSDRTSYTFVDGSQITISYIDQFGMKELTGSFSSGATERFFFGDQLVHADIYINSGKTFTPRCLEALVRHELGHALDQPHHAESVAVMYFSISIPSCRYTLALEDFDQFDSFDPCFAELDADYNISIPVISANGESWSVYFNFLPATATWGLSPLRPQAYHDCNEISFIDNVLTVDRASSPLGWITFQMLLNDGIWSLIDYELL